MVAALDVRASSAVPVAVELSEEHGLEVLWSEPVSVAPAPWTAVEGGWSWVLSYDPEAPTPLDALPAPLPSLVTVGRRDGLQLLLNVEGFGAIGVSGPDELVNNFLRSIATELALGEELSDATVFTVGMAIGSAEAGRRCQTLGMSDVCSRLAAVRESLEAALGSRSGAYSYRAGPEGTHLESTVAVVAGATDADVMLLMHAAAADRGVGVVTHDPAARCAARIELTSEGACLRPLGIEFEPVQLPDATDADLAELVLSLRETATEAAVDSGGEALGSPDEPAVHLRCTGAPEASGDGTVRGSHDGPELLVRVLGQPRVDGRPGLGERQLSLTAFLAVRRRPATLADILEALWGGDEVRSKTVLNLISSTRGALGSLTSGGLALPAAEQAQKTYTLADGVTTDYEILRQAYERAQQSPDAESIQALDEALDLVQGRPFGTAGFEWAFRDGQYGAAATDLIEQAALTLARLACATGDTHTARRAIRRGLDGVPGNEVLYRARMQLEADVGNAAGVQQAYKELVNHLLDFEERPSQETIDLRVALRRRTSSQAPV
jgi:hypothetical protein